MKKSALGLLAAGVVLFGTSIVSAGDYPILNPAVSVDNPMPAPSGAVVATVTECLIGETVNFDLEGSLGSDVCAASASLPEAVSTGGVASATLTAPAAAGAYVGTATLVQSQSVLPFDVTVVVAATTTTVAPTTVAPTTAAPTTQQPTTSVTGILPSTGADSNGLTTVAIGLLVAGVAFFGVAQTRRRRLPS